MNVVRLSALRTGLLYHPRNTPGTHFCYRMSRPQGHNAAGMIMSMKNSKDTIGNGTRDLPACSAMPQPTEPLRTSPPTYTTLKPTLKLHVNTKNTYVVKELFVSIRNMTQKGWGWMENRVLRLEHEVWKAELSLFHVPHRRSFRA